MTAQDPRKDRAKVSAPPRNLKEIALEVFGDKKKESTVRYWVKTFNIPSELIDNERIFDENTLPIFHRIKALKAQKPRLSASDIRLELALLDDPEPAQRPRKDRAKVSAPPRKEFLRGLAPLMEEHTQTLITSVHEMVKAEAQTSEKYAQATHQIGQLEVMLRVTQDQLAEAKKQILALPETTQALVNAQKEIEDLKLELDRAKTAQSSAETICAELRDQVDNLEAEKAKVKPWWKIWS